MLTYALRQTPGDDLHVNLLRFVQQQRIGAGFVLSCVGSLGPAMIRFAGLSAPSLVAGPLEIVSLTGTLCADGMHLHIAVADAGGRVSGGHLCVGCIVRTTAEIVIGASDAFRFTRAYDAATGYRELHIETGAIGDLVSGK